MCLPADRRHELTSWLVKQEIADANEELLEAQRLRKEQADKDAKALAELNFAIDAEELCLTHRLVSWRIG